MRNNSLRSQDLEQIVREENEEYHGSERAADGKPRSFPCSGVRQAPDKGSEEPAARHTQTDRYGNPVVLLMSRVAMFRILCGRDRQDFYLPLAVLTFAWSLHSDGCFHDPRQIGRDDLI